MKVIEILEERMKSAPRIPVPKGDFTRKGYNDMAKPCLDVKCEGYVLPTMNANVGRCNTCGQRYGWGTYKELGL